MQRTPRKLGRIWLYDAIASGGMGTVHLGRLVGSAGFRRLVAIKRMSSTVARDRELVRRFRAEAALAGRLLHPNVVSTLDVILDEGELFLVMELVRGDALSKLLASAREQSIAVPVSIATGIMVGALSGLHAAHEATDEQGAPLGLVHRDVSPQNILVGVDGLAKIADFGIAQSTLGAGAETAKGRVRGKVRYLAPEQLGFDRDAVDRRTDLFASAVVLWEMLAGRPLFDGDDAPDVIEQILSGDVPSVRAVRPDVPPAVDAVLSAALSRSASLRPATALDLAASLEGAAGGVASSRAIGQWVREIARDRIDSMDRMIAAIEQLAAEGPGEEASARPDREDDLETGAVEVTPRRPAPSEAAALPIRSVLEDDGTTRTLTLDSAIAAAAAERSAARPRSKAWRVGVGTIAAATGLAALIGARAARETRVGAVLARDATLAELPSARGPGPTAAAASAAAPSAAEPSRSEGRASTELRPAPPKPKAAPPRVSAKPRGAEPASAPMTNKPYVADRP